ncbi:dihydroxyacetone kinase phosphoryl donor subunit DhaM [Glaciihabitans sp. UYNi722]|uniref:dihydroxyacetone kinase phosphoryl donor subunit DhaM n=1 Tax=Glaciihabitans sp. UYNi722 TaxID=3156344 RepID=UPI00339A3CA4
MIGIVVVSHSPALAQAAVDLALEMVAGDRPAIAIAAGAGDGVIGTDATKVAAAIDEVAGPDGVLVVMDLGSAVMSAEMALDFRTSDVEVKLSSAPFVEGLLAAIVTASGGANLADVASEANAALDPKRGMLGDPPPVAEASVEAAAPQANAEELTIMNRDGLHARPAATLVSALAGFDAKVTIANTRTEGKPVAGNSLIGLLSLGAKEGDVVVVAASGPQAAEALDRVRELVTSGFGEMGDAAAG